MIYPLEYDLKCYRGQTWEQALYIKDKQGQAIDLTGASARAQVRPTDNSETLTAEMTCSITASLGRISLGLSADVTGAIKDGVYMYDLRVVSADMRVTYYLHGKFVVRGRVTA